MIAVSDHAVHRLVERHHDIAPENFCETERLICAEVEQAIDAGRVMRRKPPWLTNGHFARPRHGARWVWTPERERTYALKGDTVITTFPASTVEVELPPRSIAPPPKPKVKPRPPFNYADLVQWFGGVPEPYAGPRTPGARARRAATRRQRQARRRSRR